MVLGSWRGTAWRLGMCRQATHGVFTNFWFLDDEPGGIG